MCTVGPGSGNAAGGYTHVAAACGVRACSAGSTAGPPVDAARMVLNRRRTVPYLRQRLVFVEQRGDEHRVDGHEEQAAGREGQDGA